MFFFILKISVGCTGEIKILVLNPVNASIIYDAKYNDSNASFVIKRRLPFTDLRPDCIIVTISCAVVP